MYQKRGKHSMKNPFARLARSRDKPSNAVSAAISFFMGLSQAGKPVNERTALQMTTVYACVRVISETIASLPLHIYRYTDAGKERDYKHPLYRILHDEPNSEMTSFVFRETLMTHLLLWGNAYAQIIRNGRGDVAALYPLLPDRMRVDRNEVGQLFYEYTKDGVIHSLKPWDVLHVPGLGFDGIMGYSPIAVSKNAIGLAIAAEEYGSKFFSNGATPTGVLTHPGKVGNPSALRTSWNEAYGGSKNAGRVAILEEGMKFEKVSIPNDEAQFLESRKFQVSEICRIYRVPPHMIGDLEKATFSNIEHQAISFATHTIRPWAVRWEQAMNRALLPERDKAAHFIKFNLDGLQRGDYKTRMEGYAIGRQNGWLNANDIRELEDLNPIPAEEGGEEYAVNGNMIPLKALRQMTAAKEVKRLDDHRA